MTNFINQNFNIACVLQNQITVDTPMILMITGNNYNEITLRNWMRKYGLLRGINTNDCNLIVTQAINAIPTILNQINIINANHQIIETSFCHLLTAFHNTIQRKWVSAVSKLLWCANPNHFIIYDSFVKQAITTIQALSVGQIYELPRVGSLDNQPTVEDQVSYYMRYQNIVRSLYQHHEEQILTLMQINNVEYPYPIRIFDKLLWIAGNPKSNLAINLGV